MKLRIFVVNHITPCSKYPGIAEFIFFLMRTKLILVCKILSECSVDDGGVENCLQTNFSYYANLVRSSCRETLDLCWWNEIQFDCCDYFHPMETELGLCYAINSNQVR